MKPNTIDRHPYREKTNKRRPIIFQIALLLSLGFVFWAFQWTSIERIENEVIACTLGEEKEIVHIPNTWHEKKKTLPPVIKATEYIPDDEVPEFTEDEIPEKIPDDIVITDVDSVNDLPVLKKTRYTPSCTAHCRKEKRR